MGGMEDMSGCQISSNNLAVYLQGIGYLKKMMKKK